MKTQENQGLKTESREFTKLDESNSIYYKADSRGFFDFGWLKTYHSFSFGSYFDPERIRFGALRVLNDDSIDAAQGFGTHPHDNMEIVTIPLLGALAHKDSMGNTEIIRKGEVQIMSAGTGITHSEFNASNDEDAAILQIWVLPKKRGIAPRYGQKVFPGNERQNQFQLIVSPTGDDAAEKGPVWINQDAYFSLGNFESGTHAVYTKNLTSNGLFIFVIEGKVQVNGKILDRRDGLGLYPNVQTQIDAVENSEILIIEVPGFD
ncbi:pirin family protein [Leptospira sp. GIMC2001]|uniref:pirin family protein n=1 Tax=Leptospira sp. GIMC2001 TaxID=1513297 RepID=UPI00234905F8|nr:pirin family protein [Leptospira sp. GIMC2001]WCL48975.1 pirin family protein [Leptospira sp. GIMC2001]